MPIMEKNNSQNSSLMGTAGANDESILFYPTSPNERMIQESLQKVQKGTQTTLMPPFSNSKISGSNLECKIDAAHTETKNDPVANASLYESFSVDESKYDSFDDSLEEEAHISPTRINVSNFLSEQVNVTVRKVRERQKTKGSNLCDSLEDICSLVSNAEHISTSDEIEYINNVLEKHGICEDSLRNDICYDNRNASLNELNFDDDSLAILEVEKPFDDSLEDVDVVSCVDSLMILGNSIGEGDVVVDKLLSENCGTRNLLETSVQIIYENAPISSDESFRTAENFNSNKNSVSLSDCPMSRDSLEEIHDISEIASSEKSLNYPPKTNYVGNEPFPSEKTAASGSLNENVFECDVKQTCSEPSPTTQNRTSRAESERTSSVVNSCYFYDTFCMDDSVQLPPEFDNSKLKDLVTDPNYLTDNNLKATSEVTEKLAESNNESFSCPSYFQDIGKNKTTANSDVFLAAECLVSRDTSNNTCIIAEKGAAVIPFCDQLNKSSSKFLKDEGMNSVIGDSDQLLPLSPQTKDESPISVPASEKECSQNKVVFCKVKVNKASSIDSSPSQFVVPEEYCKKAPQHLHDSVSGSSQKSIKNISTCVAVCPSVGELTKNNVTAKKTLRKNEALKNSKHGTDQKNLKLHIELAINQNHDVNVVSVSSVEQATKNEANKLSEKTWFVVNDNEGIKTPVLSNQTNDLQTAACMNEVDALEKIMTEAHKKLPTLPKLSEEENSNDDQQKLIFSGQSCSAHTVQIKLDICNAQLLQALDLHDSFCGYTRQQLLQSRDSIMPLNLCVRDLSPQKRNDDVFESKENVPFSQKCKTSPSDKGTFTPSKSKLRDLKKVAGKPCLITKIPIRKAESPLSIPLNQKQFKHDLKSSPYGGKQVKSPLVKSTSIDSIGKTGLDEMSRKHHFCMIRNSICRVPKSLEKPNAKKFQNVQSPVAKYIGSAKVNSPLKTTHRYDGNLISPLPSKLTPKTTNNAFTSVPEATVAKKVVRRLKS